jgi:hypothetical protein
MWNSLRRWSARLVRSDSGCEPVHQNREQKDRRIGGSNARSDGLQKWLYESVQTLDIAIGSWDYKVTASRPKGTPSILFQWEGWLRRQEKERLPVSGEFIILDKDLIEDWADHPFVVGEARLLDEDRSDPLVAVTIRLNEICRDEILNAFLMGFGCRGSGGVFLRIHLHRLSEAEWEKLKDNESYQKDKELLCIRSYTVFSGGRVGE